MGIGWIFLFFIAVEYNILTVITPTAVFIEAVDGNFKIFITPLLRRRCHINNSVWLWVINSVRFAVYKTWQFVFYRRSETTIGPVDRRNGFSEFVPLRFMCSSFRKILSLSLSVSHVWWVRRRSRSRTTLGGCVHREIIKNIIATETTAYFFGSYYCSFTGRTYNFSLEEGFSSKTHWNSPSQ